MDRSSTIGISVETVPTFDVSAPFETGIFRANAGDEGHVKTRPTDTDKVDERTCRRDEGDSFSSRFDVLGFNGFADFT